MHRRHEKPAYAALFDHDDFQFGLEILLGACQHGSADAGEVLVTAARIKEGDADAWVREWTATADVVEAAGRDAAAAGRRVSALAYLRRAATYLAAALDQIDAGHEHDGKLALWRRQLHRRGGRRPPLRADGAGAPRRPRVRLARPLPAVSGGQLASRRRLR